MIIPEIQFFPLYLLVFIFGLVIGSFLNVLVYRVPKKISIIKGRSYCPSCNHKILDRDLVPVLSYILLGGKCRHCGSKISLRYPIVELSTGLMALGIVFVKGIFLEALVIFALGVILLAISLIDIETMTIPDSLIIAIIPLVILIAWVTGDWNIWGRIIGALIISVPMYISLYFVKDGFGGGDIKLFAVLGLFLGWENMLLTILISSVLGAVIGIIMTKSKKENISGKHIPFGPYICFGAMIAALFGNAIITWYLGLYI
ncbi:MAG: prepilin peptidase [Firmicutes bacterium]|nr:prepilin peptidase [Bacillota bacterium]